MSEIIGESMKDYSNAQKRALLQNMMSEVDGCFEEQAWEIRNFIESFFNEIEE